MADTIGGVVPLPTMGATGPFVADPEILWSYAGLIQKGVTIKGGGGTIAAGTVLARETASGKYVAYNNGGGGGAEVAVGILRMGVDATSDCLGNIVLAGSVRYSKLTGWDSAAATDLNARVDTVLDTVIF